MSDDAVRAPMLAPFLGGHLTVGGTDIVARYFPVVPVLRSDGLMEFRYEPVFGPPAPEVVLELPGMRVLRYEDGSHLIEQTYRPSAAFTQRFVW